MNYTKRVEYGNSLASMQNWNYTTYLRGQYNFKIKYVDTLCERLVKCPDIQGVFASLEKDRLDHNNHLHLMISSNKSLNRYKLSKLTKVQLFLKVELRMTRMQNIFMKRQELEIF